ncbi:MAG: hypothetical protein RBS39_04035 [Phycisphaerales bacterium]|jgi:hypothetical protein|nr:hypothetical protein [Phycisphaerales bacterium]
MSESVPSADVSLECSLAQYVRAHLPEFREAGALLDREFALEVVRSRERAFVNAAFRPGPAGWPARQPLEGGVNPDAPANGELPPPAGFVLSVELARIDEMNEFDALIEALEDLSPSAYPLDGLDLDRLVRMTPTKWRALALCLWLAIDEDAGSATPVVTRFQQTPWHPESVGGAARFSVRQLARVPWQDLVEAVLAKLRVGSVRTTREPRGDEAPPPGPGEPSDAGPKMRLSGPEALDENDIEVLKFLNKTPSRRWKVSEVLPDEGPGDRKAVSKRLRKLAERTIPLVDYPQGKRAGVAITEAGIEALKRSAPPTPPIAPQLPH